ncbi:hypothetical protein BOSEA31B_20376 [Hyphomicrobiales bacterium]|nr:hypothetical protein BOSEA31B_20376 [Hyphomicrobiales bacterium]CAH1702248.1 hypothetical protein BOSEA1005_30120 [Hyphomicrobiales bacterium]CAI0346451.1 hypothetical protein BO1005MUT1_510092 [Hyphomicrobiales bacterium]
MKRVPPVQFGSLALALIPGPMVAYRSRREGRVPTRTRSSQTSPLPIKSNRIEAYHLLVVNHLASERGEANAQEAQRCQ